MFSAEPIAALVLAAVSWTNQGPGGGGWIQSLAWDAVKPDRLHVGCDVAGYFVSEDAGAHYAASNCGLGGLFVETIRQDPRRPDVLFAGLRGGIYRSVDGGRTWKEERTGDFPPHQRFRYSLEISDFDFDPEDPDVVYACTGQPRYGTGGRGEIYRSEDGGRTWRQIVAPGGPLEGRSIISLSVHCRKPREMLVSTDRGVFRSEDGGVRWTPSNAGLPDHLRTRRLVRGRERPDIVYVSLKQEGGEREWNAGVFRSEDGGRTWSPRREGLQHGVAPEGRPSTHADWVDRLAIDPHDADTVYAGGASWRDTGVYRTTDGGLHWKKTTPPDLQKRGGWIRWWGPTCYSLSVSPADPRRIAFGTSGMVFVSEDSGETWRQRYCQETPDGRFSGTGLEVTCLHTIVPDCHVPDRILFGYFDIGLLISEDGGLSFRRAMDGIPRAYGNSCFTLVQDRGRPQHWLGGFGNWGDGKGVLAESLDNGLTWSVVRRPEAVAELAPRGGMALFGDRVLYASRQGLADAGGLLKDEPWMPAVRRLFGSGDRVYALTEPSGTEPGLVYGSDDGRVWTCVADRSLRLGRIGQVASDGDRLLLAASSVWKKGLGLMNGGVWLSEDRGRNWRKVFTNEFASAACIASDRLLVGCFEDDYHDHAVSDGFFESLDGGRTWLPASGADGSSVVNRNSRLLVKDPFDPTKVFATGSSFSIGRLPAE